MGSETVYLTELADRIGPRPATSEAEAAAADYIEDLFAGHGLDVERQEFSCPRTYSWSFAIYHVLTIVAGVGARWLPWPALILAFIVAVFMWRDLETRWALSNLMPKGPSQNVIGRHVPKARRGERTSRVVIVAHYDSAKASLAFAPSMVKNFRTTFRLMKWSTYAVPLVILLILLPIPGSVDTWLWYAALVPSAFLLIPLLVAIHRELFMKPTPGANDNASGVAAMLGVLDVLVPERVDVPAHERPSRRRSAEVTWAASDIPEDDLLSFAPAGEEGPGRARRAPIDDDEIEWEEGPGPARGQTSMGFDDASERKPADEDRGSGTAPRADRAGIRDWLGVDEAFDARHKGAEIGTWDKFDDEEANGDDPFGSKGGEAGPEEPEESPAPEPAQAPERPHPASLTGELPEDLDSAAQIRRRVTSGIDRGLSEKEVWFVATGAEEAGTWGMRALLAEYAEDLKDSVIINLDNLGSGNLCFITAEGMGKRLPSAHRLTGAAKRVIREDQLPIKSREYRLLSTDATPALARGYRAMSVMAFDINGRLPNWHWSTDEVENVQVGNVELAVDFVSKLIRDL
jgi:hypothetical protein